MEALFKKHFWVVQLAAVAIIVGFLGSAFVTKLGASKLLLDHHARRKPQAEADLDEIFAELVRRLGGEPADLSSR